MENAGASPLEQQTYINAARRELARQRPDGRKMGEASLAAQAYKDSVGQQSTKLGFKDQAGLGQPGSFY